MGFSRQEYWSGLPFPSPVDHILSDLSTMTRPSWVAPHGMAWFHWVRQGCGPSGIRLTSFLWLWFQCVCPLMPSHNTYCLTWVSLTLDVGYLFTAAPAKRWGCPSWLWTWSSSSQLSCAPTAAAPWTWVCSSQPPPLKWPWGSSSRPPPLTSDVG